MPKFFVGGNFKCNGTRESIASLVSTFNGAPAFPPSVDVVVSPTALHIGYVQDNLRKDMSVCAQNISTDAGFGAMTGELTAEVFTGFGVNWTLTGHSERRRRLQQRKRGHDENSDGVSEKTQLALKAGMSVVVCIGEVLSDRESGKTLDVCFEQLAAVKDKLLLEDWSRIVVAYEPVWAIGTGVSASPQQAQEVHAAIRKWLMTEVSAEVAEQTRIIYGGSVKPATAPALIECVDIDGFLVGGCSLTADFIEIIKAIPAEFDEQRRAHLKADANSIQSIGADGMLAKM
jgi:triosephosphate isomerase